MRVLQVIWDGGGNVAPQLALTRELIARGHEVIVLGHRCQERTVEVTGARFLAYRHAPDADASRPETDILRDWEARTPVGALARTRDRLMFGPAALFARDVAEHPADVVAWDYLLPGAGVGAEATGSRSVAVVHTVYPLPAPGGPPFGPGLKPMRGPAGRLRDRAVGAGLNRLFAPGLEPLNRARAEHGLAPLDDAFDAIRRADRVLVLTAPEFDFAKELPANVVYAGPVVPEMAPAEPDDPPLVLASFSTSYMDQTGLARRAVEALAALPVRGIVTTGPAIDAAALPPAANVEIRDWVPHEQLLPRASLMVTHAGLGTVHAALAAGVPLVCVPGGRDQNDNAARVMYHGAGLKASPRRLRPAIERALADPSLREGAARLQRAMTGGADRAADEIEALATS